MKFPNYFFMLILLAGSMLTSGMFPPAQAEPLHDLQIVAHEDDDLIFMNPDIQESINSGNYVRTVFVTSGNLQKNGADVCYWKGRELGELTAYATMAGKITETFCAATKPSEKKIKSYYLFRTVTLPNHSGIIDLYTLKNTALPDQVTLTFLRLSGTSRSARLWPLEHFWNGHPNQLTTVGDIGGSRRSYTLDQLITLLTGIMQDYQPDRIRTHESTGIYYFDHTDHLHTGRMALEAYRRYIRTNPSSGLLMYRGYNVYYLHDYPMLQEKQNVTGALFDAKKKVLNNYCVFDCKTGGNADRYMAGWGARHYSLSAVTDPKSIFWKALNCLKVAEDGTTVRVTQCKNSLRQQWHTDRTGRLSYGGKFLGIAEDGVTVQMVSYDKATAWIMLDNGVVVGDRSKVMKRGKKGIEVKDYFSYTPLEEKTGKGVIGGLAEPDRKKAADSLRWIFPVPPVHPSPESPASSKI
jgi:LmbE family N-acetylglucosaminyl deacetylase